MKLTTSAPEDLNGKGLNIAIVLSRFNDSLGNIMLKNTVETLENLGVNPGMIKVIKVPGALELPLAVKLLTNKKKFVSAEKKKIFDAIIALGIVIKGETAHFEHVCTETHRGLMNVSIETETPIIFGVITAMDESQAVDRVEKDKLNKGKEYAEAAVEMALLQHKIEG